MKIETSKRALLDLLAAAAPVFPTSQLITPIIQLWCQPGCPVTGSASLSGLSIAMKLTATADGALDNPILLPIGPLREWLGSFKEESEICIVAHAGQSTIELRADEQCIEFAVAMGLLHPDPIADSFTHVLDYRCDRMKDLTPFTFTGDGRPELEGIYLGLMHGEMVAAAINGVMFCYNPLVSDEQLEESLYIPPHAVDLVTKMSGPVSVAQSQSRFRFINGETTVYSVKSAAKTAPWRRVLEGVTYVGEAKVITSDLEEAVRSCHCVRGGGRFAGVTIESSNDGLLISAKTPSGSCGRTITAKRTGNIIKRIVPSDNVLKFIQKSKDDLTRIKFGDDKMPILLTTSDGFNVGIVPITNF